MESLILLEARPCAGESDAEIVAGAWNFDQINRCYSRHLKVLEERPDELLENETVAKAFLRWSNAEREAWIEAVTSDPLLPNKILPKDYLGKRAWQRRIEVLEEAGRQLRTFRQQTTFCLIWNKTLSNTSNAATAGIVA